MTITLRKLNTGDLKFLNEIRGKELPKLHYDRFTEQDKGESIYLIAFQDGRPVGHVYVKFEGDEEYHNSPVLQDLYVSEELRGKKIGTQIIQETEKYLKELGYNEISIDVETNKEWIKQFYEKQEFGLKSGPHKQSWIEKDTEEEINIDVFHLEKKIK